MKPPKPTPELFLPLEQAIPIAAYQNMLVDRINDPPDTFEEEARYPFEETRENYQGEHGHPTIKVATEPGDPRFKTITFKGYSDLVESPTKLKHAEKKLKAAKEKVKKLESLISWLENPERMGR